MQELLEMVGEINIVSYNDKAILERYMELKEEQRKTEKLKKVNDKNKQSLKKWVFVTDGAIKFDFICFVAKTIAYY